MNKIMESLANESLTKMHWNVIAVRKSEAALPSAGSENGSHHLQRLRCVIPQVEDHPAILGVVHLHHALP